MTEPVFDVVTIGDVVVDLTVAGHSAAGNLLYERNPGGGPANVVATVAALGGRSAFMGKVGDDHLGHFLECTLRSAGVDTSGLHYAARTGTRLVFIDLDEHNDRTFTPYRSPRSDLEFRPDDIVPGILTRTRIFHTCMLANLAAPLRQASEIAIQTVRESGGLISFDPNWAEAASTDQAVERETIERVVGLVDVLKLSLPEFAFLQGSRSLEEGAALLRRAGPGLVVVTLGERGAYFQTATASGYVDCPRVQAEDTTGAGDAFVGGLLFALTSGITDRQELAGLSEAKLREALVLANACGAICSTRRGSLRSVPSLADIQNLLTPTL